MKIQAKKTLTRCGTIICIGFLLLSVIVTGAPVKSVGAIDNPEETSAPEVMETEVPVTEASILPLKFRIDDTGRYEGMERSYEKGYIPTIENDKAILILPLVTDGEVLGKTITVTPSLGSTSESPFVYRNYQKTINESRQLPKNAGDGAEPVAMYLVRLELELSDNRNNGVYPVEILVEARDADGMTVTQNFTTYVTITDGKSRETEIAEETKTETRPFLYIESFKINPDPVVAGDEFSVTAVIRNANDEQDAENLVVTVSSGIDDFTLLEESNTILWEELKAGESRELTLRYRADSLMSIGKYHIKLDISFEDIKANQLSSNGDMTVTVTQPMRISAEYPTITEGANAGDTISLTFQAVNLGKSAAYNVRFELDAPGLIPMGSAYIGNLEGGTSGSTQMKVFFGSKSMNRDMKEGEDLYGYTSGIMTMIYEDENGTEYREEKSFGTNIYELIIGTETEEEEAEDIPSFQWWIAVIAGAVLLVAVFGVTFWRKRSHE